MYSGTICSCDFSIFAVIVIQVKHLVPLLAYYYFQEKLPIALSHLQASLLLCMGLQLHDITYIEVWYQFFEPFFSFRQFIWLLIYFCWLNELHCICFKIFILGSYLPHSFIHVSENVCWKSGENEDRKAASPASVPQGYGKILQVFLWCSNQRIGYEIPSG